MPTQFRISVRFLDGKFHGRGDGGEPEWPPSPLRLFQAIVSSAATQWSDVSQLAKDATALRWLERQPPPTIAAACRATIQPNGYQLYVPDNVGDVVAKSWTNGVYFDSKNHPIDIASYRTDKFVRPTRLVSEKADKCDYSDLAFPAVHYQWSIDTNQYGMLSAELRETLIGITRSVSRLGWGVDLVVTDAAFSSTEEDNEPLAGERWLPVDTPGGASLRVPIAGALDALDERHAAFLNRIRHLDNGGDVFSPVPPLSASAFRMVTYRRETELSRPPFAIFALRKPDDSAFAAFDPQWRRLHLAGMLRHTASQPDFATALSWDKNKVDTFVLGHDKSSASKTQPTANVPRLVFIPLPSIEWRGEDRGRTVGAIRRVLVTVSGGEGECIPGEFSRIIRALEGRELIGEKEKRPIAFLRQQSSNDSAIAPYYFGESSTWTTVTPVVLPGHDDPRKLRRRLSDPQTPLSAFDKKQTIHKLDTRIERLLRKALLDSGLPSSLVVDADLQWRDTGFFPGADLVSRYSVPDQCRRFRRVHVRVVWRERTPDGKLRPMSLAGPFCVGSGRFFGLGLFIPTNEA